MAVLALTAVLLLVEGYVYLVSGLVVPATFLIPLWVAWFVLAGMAVALRRRPLLALIVPFAGAGFWLLYVGGLGALLDWTA